MLVVFTDRLSRISEKEIKQNICAELGSWKRQNGSVSLYREGEEELMLAKSLLARIELGYGFASPEFWVAYHVMDKIRFDNELVEEMDYALRRD